VNTNNDNILLKAAASKIIFSVTPFTMVDYPNETACILWFAGCNMECVYCYNPEIVYGKGEISFEQVETFLNSRQGLLDGVVLSGGECTLHKSIIEVCKKIKSKDFKIKIDTNGTNPEIIKKLLESELLDYVALDFKALKQKFEFITANTKYKNFELSLKMLLDSKINFEVRTTFHRELMSVKELILMKAFLNELGYEKAFYVQQFVSSKKTIGNLSASVPFSDDELIELQKANIVVR
jgi:pyruvate formate lyase activating enzyme